VFRQEVGECLAFIEVMMTGESNSFLSGVIEGFYGPPWTQAERLELFDWMTQWGLNTYLYAPKDDLKQRAIWRKLYTQAELDALREVIAECHQRGLRFVYAVSPGLDIRYSSETDLERLKHRFAQVMALGCQDFGLFFDDIPDRLEVEDIQRWGSLASAQSQITNTVFQWVRERSPTSRFLFCPTPYCSRMVAAKLGGEGYLPTIGAELLPEIDIFWTGPDIISRDITVTHIKDLQGLLGRKPLIWDNLHANDYDGRRFYCGPYDGRPPELRAEVSGLMINPNTEFPLNYVPLRTFAAFVNGAGEWDSRAAYLAAMREWFPRFATVGRPVTFEELVTFGDCYYLPYQEGPEAQNLYRRVQALLAKDPAHWGAEAAVLRADIACLRDFCARMAELRNRPLFNALSRRVWELREELDLLDRYIAYKADSANHELPFSSDFHRPGTYRGGMVAGLQQLLAPRSGGELGPAGGISAGVVADEG
jgi:protein O-GlcNAcase/histone acetyltransferase